MIRTDAEYRSALKRLDQEAETMERQRAHLCKEMDLTEEEARRAMQPMISFRAQLEEEIESYESMRRGDLGALYNLRVLGRWLIGARTQARVDSGPRLKSRFPNEILRPRLHNPRASGERV